MGEEIRGRAFGKFEFDNLVACLVAMDAAAKAADIEIQGVERNRVKAGVCVKIRGNVSAVRAAMEAAVAEGSRYGKLTGKNVIAAPSEHAETAIRSTIYK